MPEHCGFDLSPFGPRIRPYPYCWDIIGLFHVRNTSPGKSTVEGLLGYFVEYEEYKGISLDGPPENKEPV